MKRRVLLKSLTVLAILPLLAACSRGQAIARTSSTIVPLNKPREAWREFLSPEAYRVLFEEDTERPSTSALNYEDRDGVFICAACYLPLFESAYKYESGTGWPSFTQPIAGHVETKRDFKMIIPRTEYHLAENAGATMAYHYDLCQRENCYQHLEVDYDDSQKSRCSTWRCGGAYHVCRVRTDRYPESRCSKHDHSR